LRRGREFFLAHRLYQVHRTGAVAIRASTRFRRRIRLVRDGNGFSWNSRCEPVEHPPGAARPAVVAAL